MDYGGFKHVTRRRASDTILHDKASNIAKNPKHDGYQTGLVSTVKTFGKKNWFRLHSQRPELREISLPAVVVLKKEIPQNKELAEEL